MRSSRIMIVSLALLASACGNGAAPPPDLERIATIKDIMDSMVDPSGDFLFDSVVEIADENGITHKSPQTDEDWKDVRRRAFVLFEAPNLMAMEGRKVALPGEKAENPSVELEPEQIQKMVDEDRPAFIRRARRLQNAAGMAIKAADSKSRDDLFNAIEAVDHACENCHLHYWYPNDQRAQEAARESGLDID